MQENTPEIDALLRNFDEPLPVETAEAMSFEQLTEFLQEEKELQKADKKLKELNTLYHEIINKGGSERKASRAIQRREKIPTFKEQLKNYFREKNKV